MIRCLAVLGGPSATGEQTEAADCLKSDAVLFELITAAVRVLLTRPLEMQRVCGRLFRLVTANVVSYVLNIPYCDYFPCLVIGKRLNIV